MGDTEMMEGVPNVAVAVNSQGDIWSTAEESDNNARSGLGFLSIPWGSVMTLGTMMELTGGISYVIRKIKISRGRCAQLPPILSGFNCSVSKL